MASVGGSFQVGLLRSRCLNGVGGARCLLGQSKRPSTDECISKMYPIFILFSGILFAHKKE